MIKLKDLQQLITFPDADEKRFYELIKQRDNLNYIIEQHKRKNLRKVCIKFHDGTPAIVPVLPSYLFNSNYEKFKVYFKQKGTPYPTEMSGETEFNDYESLEY